MRFSGREIVLILREMRRVFKRGAEIAIYLWDYAESMQMLRYFWDAVISLNPGAWSLDEKERFPICQPDVLQATVARAGLAATEIRALEAPAPFASFDDYWRPFLGGVGPAPGYVASLSRERQAELQSVIKNALPVKAEGSIPLCARAWAVRAIV